MSVVSKKNVIKLLVFLLMAQTYATTAASTNLMPFDTVMMDSIVTDIDGASAHQNMGEDCDCPDDCRTIAGHCTGPCVDMISSVPALLADNSISALAPNNLSYNREPANLLASVALAVPAPPPN